MTMFDKLNFLLKLKEANGGVVPPEPVWDHEEKVDNDGAPHVVRVRLAPNGNALEVRVDEKHYVLPFNAVMKIDLGEHQVWINECAHYNWDEPKDDTAQLGAAVDHNAGAADPALRRWRAFARWLPGQ